MNFGLSYAIPPPCFIGWLTKKQTYVGLALFSPILTMALTSTKHEFVYVKVVASRGSQFHRAACCILP